MFDYNLVSTKAVYRNFIPRDLPDLLGLAARRAEEMKTDPAAAREAVSSTVQEFSRHKGRGSVLLIDVEELPVGYCILCTGWSHALGGTVLRVQELYVSAGARGRGLEEDLLALLAEIAPSGAVALELGFPAADRRAEAAWRKAGFHRDGTTVMIRQTRKETP